MLPSTPLCSLVIALLINNLNGFCLALSLNANFKQIKKWLCPNEQWFCTSSVTRTASFANSYQGIRSSLLSTIINNFFELRQRFKKNDRKDHIKLFCSIAMLVHILQIWRRRPFRSLTGKFFHICLTSQIRLPLFRSSSNNLRWILQTSGYFQATNRKTSETLLWIMQENILWFSFRFVIKSIFKKLKTQQNTSNNFISKLLYCSIILPFTTYPFFSVILRPQTSLSM